MEFQIKSIDNKYLLSITFDPYASYGVPTINEKFSITDIALNITDVLVIKDRLYYIKSNAFTDQQLIDIKSTIVDINYPYITNINLNNILEFFKFPLSIK